MNRILGFDAARSLAIALVVLSHIHQGSHQLGVIGVELFFALSGFLIGTILYRSLPEQGKWTWKGVGNFWKRRWWRTLPNYYLFLFVAIAFHGSRGEWPEGGAAGILPYFLFVQNLMSPNEMFFGVSWSLCVEETFYLLFPLLLLLFHRVTESRKIAFLIAGGFVFLGSVALREVLYLHYPPDLTRVSTLPRLDTIGYGVAVAVLAQLVDLDHGKRLGLSLVGGILFIGSVVAYPFLAAEALLDYYRVAYITVPLSFSLMMPALGSWNLLPSRLEFLRLPITRISQWSYSIYLSHFTIIMAIYPLFGSTRDNALVNLFSKFVGLGVTLAVSALVYRYFETRFTALRPPEVHDADPGRRETVPTSASVSSSGGA